MKEINLNVGTGLDAFPMSKKVSSNNGGPTMSADSAASRIVMSRVNKNMEKEPEETSEEEDLLSEFSDVAIDRIAGVTKSALFSIPVFGDLFAFGKFLITIAKMRSYSKKFAKQLSELSGVDIGDDILEAEGSITSDQQLDAALIEATGRLSNIIEYESNYGQLDVTMKDIKSLESNYFLMCKYVKDAIMEFIGFADFAFAQKGFFLNAGISMVTFSNLPDFIIGEYSDIVSDMHKKAKNENDEGLIAKIKDAAASFISVPGKMLDFLGNADLLLNPEKLARLATVHNMINKYSDVDTFEERAEMGLDAIPGTPYATWLEDNYADYSYDSYSKYYDMNADMEKMKGQLDKIKSIPSVQSAMSNKMLEEVYASAINKKHSLSFIYENMEEELEKEEDSAEVEEHAVAGYSAPLSGTEQDLKNNMRLAEEIRALQVWNLKTLGNKK